jgi:hypothetical protein
MVGTGHQNHAAAVKHKHTCDSGHALAVSHHRSDATRVRRQERAACSPHIKQEVRQHKEGDEEMMLMLKKLRVKRLERLKE